MYGAIYGDIVGSIYEYNQTKKLESINPDTLVKDNSFYSDDTILTIAVLDAILNDKNYDKYLREYVQRYKDYKPNFSPYFSTAFSPNIIRWSETSSQGASRGNGALMRISPVGFMFNKEEDVIKNAVLATIPSHNSIESLYSTRVLALLIYYLNKGLSKEEAVDKLHLIINYEPFKKFNTKCYETLNNCLYAFLNSNSFDEAIRNTLLMGGDTDTNCAIVGSLAEAAYGIDNSKKEEVDKRIPEEFKKILRRI